MRLEELIEICGFRTFPFDFRPAQNPGVWAGRQDVLQELKFLERSVRVDGLAEFGVITGTHGAGKTHSLYHLKFMIEKSTETGKALVLILDNPIALGPKGTFDEVFRYLISPCLGRDRLGDILVRARDEIHRKAAEELQKLDPTRQRQITQIDAEMRKWRENHYKNNVGDSPLPYPIFLALADGKEDAWRWLSGSNGRLKEVAGENVQPLVSHIVCAKVLSTIFKLATIKHQDGTPILYDSVFLFVDQTEDLSKLGPGPYQEQIVGWRTLIDECSSRFALLWSCDGSAEEIVALFSDAIERRQTIDPEKLMLRPLEESEAVDFLADVIRYFRKDGARVAFPSYPFAADALKEIVTQTGERIPSRLLNTCRRVFVKAAQADVIHSTEDSIDRKRVLEFV